MLTTKLINGTLVHWDEWNACAILDENQELIPATFCICAAVEPSECCCGCTSWSNYKYSQDDWGCYD